MKVCEKCGKEHNGSFGSGKFCSRGCANTRVHSKETKEKISKGIKSSEKWLNNTPNLKLPNGNFKSLEDKEKFLKSVEKGIKTQKEKYKKWILNEDFNNLKFNSLKNRILFEQDSKCNKCGLKDWLNEPITLELEHKDGNHQNNSRENLECLCPNCHSQTETWRGRNKKKRKIISDEEVVLKYGECQNIRQTLISLGLAPKGANYGRVKRALTLYNIKYD